MTKMSQNIVTNQKKKWIKSKWKVEVSTEILNSRCVKCHKYDNNKKLSQKFKSRLWWNIVGSCHLYSLQSSWFRLLRAWYSHIDRISWKCGSVIQRHVTKIMTKIIWKTINHILPTWGVPVVCAPLYDVRTSPIPQTITHTQTHSRASPNVWAGVLHCTYTCSFEIVNHPFHHVYVLCVCV